MRFFSDATIYDFMGSRKQFVFVSALLVVISLVLMWVPGPKWGTDFKGGTEIEIAFKEPVSDDAIRSAVREAGFSSPDVIRVNATSSANHFILRVQEVATIGEEKQREVEGALCFGSNLNADVCPPAVRATEVKFSPGGDKIAVRFESDADLDRVRTQIATVSGIELRDGDSVVLQNPRDHKVEIYLKSKGEQLIDALKAKLGPEVVPDTALRVEWIGPKAGAQLRDSAFRSLLIAVIFIMLYIALRFDLRFAPGAVISLLHDAICTVGLLIVLNREVNLTTVAAILTLVGYSVNDTVIVYDRVRENLAKFRGTSFVQIINISLSDMLGRTILTNATVVISLMAFLVWGTGVLKDFSLTVILGVVLGTYSSIYVALPLTHWLDQRLFAHVPKAGVRPALKKKKATAVV